MTDVTPGVAATAVAAAYSQKTDPGRGRWMQTYRGQPFYLQSPHPAEINPVDIAHALSNICRYGGHSKTFYSVAQHSVLVSEIVVEHWLADHGAMPRRDLALAALLHDAAEAYVGDVVKPLKMAISSSYASIERLVEDAIAERFALGNLLRHPLIKSADRIALATERRDLLNPGPFVWTDVPDPLPSIIDAWSPVEAKDRFLARFQALTEVQP